jgi:hypothetical protein
MLWDGSLKFLELVDDDQQTAARRLLIENRVNSTRLGERLGRIGAKCRAMWWW